MKAQARHILVKTAEEAESLKQRIAKGEAFDVLAKKFSTCPSGKRGGDLGEVRPGQMVGVICCNNLAKVSMDDWREQVLRCAEKAGRPVRE